MRAKVNYSLTRTVNTGNYENFKIGVDLTVECDAEEIDKTFAEAKRFVRDKVEGEVAELLGKTEDRIEDDD
jgi:uncharacterized protein YlxP (DUF503 family)